VLEKLRTGPIAARALLVLLRRHTEFVQPTVTLHLSRDPGDDKFLECAVAGRADYIVSADTDLLTLSAIQGDPDPRCAGLLGETTRGEPVKRLDES